MIPKIITIGVYGATEESFFQALQAAGVDTFCDIRQRRGVRGARYAFVNSKRLQAQIAELGIHYLHLQELAPTKAVRQVQHAADTASKIATRKRTLLSPAFIEAYQQEILTHFDPQDFLEAMPASTQVAALFCVEREPAACHRSLAAAKLGEALGLEVEHIQP